MSFAKSVLSRAIAIIVYLRVPIAFVAGIVVGIFLAASGLLAPIPERSDAKPWGEFPVAAQVELLDDGREVKLLENFVYLDPRGRAWVAEKELRVDGASIPQMFWTVTGGPFEGLYRNASIVHDAGCKGMTDPWQDVHRMFYEACRCGGVPESQAKTLYAAVYHFGPRWTLRKVTEQMVRTGSGGHEEVVTITRNVAEPAPAIETPSREVVDRIKAFIETESPSLHEIESLDFGTR